MHTVISFLPALITIAIMETLDRWSKRPSARARYAALSLRDKIARNIHELRLAIVFQAAYLVTSTSLYLTGNLSLAGWLTGLGAAIFYLTLHLYLLRNTLAARRAYDALGPLAYLTEIKHAFGSAAGSDQSEDGVVNGWAWHTRPGEPCEACRLNRVHYDTCDCGRCPPPIPRGTVLHVSLADRLAAKMPEVFGDPS